MSTIEKHAGYEMLDSAPLQRAIRRDAQATLVDSWRDVQPHDKGLTELSERSGLHERALRRVLAQPRVRLDVADRYCAGMGRLLYDLYPELLDEAEGFVAECRKCRCEIDHDVVWESTLRMKLRCRDCGTARYLHRSPRRPPPNAFTPLPVASETLRRDYEAGLTLREIAAKHGFKSEGSVRSRLLKIGFSPRARGPRNQTQHLAQLAAARGRSTKTREARERAAPMLELWAQGLSAGVIAERLGIKTRSVYDTIHNQRRSGVDVPYRKQNGARP